MGKLQLLSNISLDAASRREDLDGVEHLVVPAVAIREGVLNNILYPSAELAEMVESWNGVPVPVNHPMDGETALTANSTACEETVNIGRFYNVRFEDNAIKGEIWINIAKAEKLGFIDIVNQLESGELMEVSTGLLAFTTEEAGDFNGSSYEAVINNIRPDHLALLPNELGACSIEDGCGAMRNNCKGKTDCSCGTKTKSNKKKGLLGKIVNLFKLNAGESFDEIGDAVRSALRATYVDAYPYIMNLYDTEVIFELGPTLYKQSYNLDSNTKATLIGDKIAVRPKVEYVPVINKEKEDMKLNNKAALVSALSVAMVANGEAATQEQKDGLTALSDGMLSNMAGQYKLNTDGTPIVETPAAPATPVPPVTNNNDALTSDERNLLNSLKQERDTRLANKRAKVTETFPSVTDVIANTMDETALDALIGSAPGVTNYAAGAGVPGQVNNSEDAHAPASIFLKTNKEGDSK